VWCGIVSRGSSGWKGAEEPTSHDDDAMRREAKVAEGGRWGGEGLTILGEQHGQPFVHCCGATTIEVFDSLTVSIDLIKYDSDQLELSCSATSPSETTSAAWA
jgi:hypothetical protein